MGDDKDKDVRDDDLHAAEHRQAWDLIPWVLNGTASEAERALVRAHLLGCADCRAAYEFEQRLQHGMALEDGPPVMDAERGLRRFWADVPAANVPAAPRRPLQRWLVAALLVQAVGLAGLGTLLGLRGGEHGGDDYQVLSRPEALPAAASIRIAPAPGLQVGELRALLARSDLQIVQASSDASQLALALAPGARFDRAQAIALLRAEPGILLAEPIGAP